MPTHAAYFLDVSIQYCLPQAADHTQHFTNTTWQPDILGGTRLSEGPWPVTPNPTLPLQCQYARGHRVFTVPTRNTRMRHTSNLGSARHGDAGRPCCSQRSPNLSHFLEHTPLHRYTAHVYTRIVLPDFCQVSWVHVSQGYCGSLLP